MARRHQPLTVRIVIRKGWFIACGLDRNCGFCLQLDELPIQARLAHELGVRALRGNAPSIEYEDSVSTSNR